MSYHRPIALFSSKKISVEGKSTHLIQELHVGRRHGEEVRPERVVAHVERHAEEQRRHEQRQEAIERRAQMGKFSTSH